MSQKQRQQAGATNLRDVLDSAAEQRAAERQQRIGIRFECHQRAVNASTTVIKSADGLQDTLVPVTPDAQLDYAQELFDWVTQEKEADDE